MIYKPAQDKNRNGKNNESKKGERKMGKAENTKSNGNVSPNRSGIVYIND